MKNKTSMWFLLCLIVTVQFFWIKGSTSFDRDLPFLSCLVRADTAAGNMLLTMYSYLPLPFFFLLFSGEMSRLVSGYGILQTIRGRSKVSLLGLLSGRVFFSIGVIVLMMTGLYLAGKEATWFPMSWNQRFQSVFMYVLTLVVMIHVQFLLELYMETQYANGLVVIGGACAIFGAGAMGEGFDKINLILFPNLAFARRNGVLDMENGGNTLIESASVLIGIYLVILLLTLKSFRKKDMI